LFQERKIERFDTARSIINDLSSGGQKKQKQDLINWSFTVANIYQEKKYMKYSIIEL
jgi:hypothetical protein